MLFKNLENKGNPWGQNARTGSNWIDEVDFDVPVYGEDVDSFDDFEYLFWVGCAGALTTRPRRPPRRSPSCWRSPGVKFLVLGAGRPATATPRAGRATSSCSSSWPQQNVETLDGVFEGVETVDRKIVATCPHCFNTLGSEYKQLGGNYTVLHHTQLLNRLVRDKKLVPVTPGQPGHHLPRPVLPGPAQQGLRGAARADRRPRRDADRNAAARQPQLLLRRGRRADVDGRAHRQADQPRARRRGAGHRRQHGRHRLPVLPGDGQRRCQRPRRGSRPRRRSTSATSPTCCWTPSTAARSRLPAKGTAAKQAAKAAPKAAPKAEAATATAAAGQGAEDRGAVAPEKAACRSQGRAPGWVWPAAPSDPAPRRPRRHRHHSSAAPSRSQTEAAPRRRRRVWAWRPAQSGPARRRPRRPPNRPPHHRPSRTRETKAEPVKPSRTGRSQAGSSSTGQGSRASRPARDDPAPRRPPPAEAAPAAAPAEAKRSRSRKPRQPAEARRQAGRNDPARKKATASPRPTGKGLGHRARCPAARQAVTPSGWRNCWTAMAPWWT